MPNWTFNTLEVTPMEYQLDNDKEKKDAVKQFKDFVKESIVPTKIYDKDGKVKGEDKDDERFTLNGVCPMPKSLMITSGTSTERGMAYIDWIENKKAKRIDEILGYGWADKEIDKRWSKDKQRTYLCASFKKDKDDWKDALKEGRMALDNIKKYGVKDWYDWSCNNWGTKWDASDSYIDEYNDRDDHYMIRIQFNTAWSPPMEWLQKATEKYPFLQFCMNVEEESEAFCGKPVAQFGFVAENITSIDYPSRDHKSAKVLGVDL